MGMGRWGDISFSLENISSFNELNEVCHMAGLNYCLYYQGLF